LNLEDIVGFGGCGDGGGVVVPVYDLVEEAFDANGLAF
jgi:hypothetical protein